MPKGAYERKYSKRKSHHKTKYEWRNKKLKLIQLFGIRKPTTVVTRLPRQEIVDDYYLTYFQSLMSEIKSEITQQEDGTFLLIVEHGGYRLGLQSSDEDTIIFTRQATIGLIEEMDRCGVGMEFYEECTLPQGQKKHGLYK